MRRAAGEEPDGAPAEGTSSDTLPAETTEASVLPKTLFPIEMPDRRRARRPSVTPDVPQRPADAAVSPAETRPVSLFDRIDVRLAQKVVVDKRVMPASREQYRRLAASLHHAQAALGTKVVMIASAVSGEGKTLTASNLALTFSESYQRSVLLIDGDLRKPGLHSVFGVDNTFGLSDGLTSPAERKLPVQRVSPRLAILTAGLASADPMAGLTSDRMQRIIDEAREGFDWVFIDTPPVAFLSDANLLAHMVDSAVLVVKAGTTSFEMVQRAIDAIGRDRTVGVVLNRADPTEDLVQYAYYDRYHQSAADSQGSA